MPQRDKILIQKYEITIAELSQFTTELGNVCKGYVSDSESIDTLRTSEKSSKLLHADIL